MDAVFAARIAYAAHLWQLPRGISQEMFGMLQANFALGSTV